MTPPRLRDGARAALPLAAAVLPFGIAYGLLATSAGFPAPAAVAMSLTTFAGSAQFASASILDTGGTAGAAIAAALMLNARYAAIGVSVASVLRGAWPRRLAEGQLVVDESWAVSATGPGRHDYRLLMGAGLVLYTAWQLGTLAGVLGGDVIGAPEDYGLDAAFPALFLALLVRQVHDRRGLVAALAGGAVALALVPVLPIGLPIVAAGFVSLAGLRSPAPPPPEAAE